MAKSDPKQVYIQPIRLFESGYDMNVDVDVFVCMWRRDCVNDVLGRLK